MDVNFDAWRNRGVRSHKHPRLIEVENDPFIGAVFVKKLAGDSALDASDGSSLHDSNHSVGISIEI